MLRLTAAALSGNDQLIPLKKTIGNHLAILQQKLLHYFPDLNISQHDWIRNPFYSIHDKGCQILELSAQEQLLELRMDCTLQLRQ